MIVPKIHTTTGSIHSNLYRRTWTVILSNELVLTCYQYRNLQGPALLLAFYVLNLRFAIRDVLNVRCPSGGSSIKASVMLEGAHNDKELSVVGLTVFDLE